MTFKFGFATVFVMASLAQTAFAAYDFECLSETPENRLCLFTPDDAPAKIEIPKADASKSAPVSLLSQDLLSGSALNIENEFAFNTAINPVDSEELNEERVVQPALASALKTQDQLRWVEDFRNSGAISPRIDGRVSAAGKK